MLADRSLANRRRRRRRLLTRQVGGGGSAQHGQGCSRSEYNDLHHDYSPYVWQHHLPEAPEMEQPKRDAPLFPSPLSQSGFHRCTINDALTALTTPPKSPCITCAIDPFQASVARIARIQPWDLARIAVFETTVPESGLRPSVRRFRVGLLQGPEARLDSNFIQNVSKRGQSDTRGARSGLG